MPDQPPVQVQNGFPLASLRMAAVKAAAWRSATDTILAIAALVAGTPVTCGGDSHPVQVHVAVHRHLGCRSTLLRGYVRHYNDQRPHRGLALAVPEAREQRPPQVNSLAVRRRGVLGGLIHEYHAVAAG
jgi:hypothetical protein